jgi:thiol-disulfide isomerase/thioredoxin
VCGSCIEEMPELEKVYEGLPKNVNMISICTDGDESNELAKNIMTVKGDKFKALIPDSKLRKSLTDSIDAFPTTVFVDKEGNIVGTQVGVPDADNIVKGYNTLIDKYLKTAISGADLGNNKEEVGSVGVK